MRSETMNIKVFNLMPMIMDLFGILVYVNVMNHVMLKHI